MNKMNVMIFHGAFGHPEENWFGWLKAQLRALDIPCYVPAFPTPEGQSLDAWLDVFQQECAAQLHENSFLIGHSLGAAFLLRVLERYQTKINTAILAGAFLGKVGIDKFDSINQSFFTNNVDWRLIKTRSQQFICYHGTNDPYVTQDQFNDIANHLQAKKILVAKGGHLNAAAGYREFTQLLLQLKQLMGRD